MARTNKKASQEKLQGRKNAQPKDDAANGLQYHTPGSQNNKK